jgi:NADH:ubiquinone oxidoreductase subunit D
LHIIFWLASSLFNRLHRAKAYALSAHNTFFMINHRCVITMLQQSANRAYSDGLAGVVLRASGFINHDSHKDVPLTNI